jgi:hypothetical protein
MKNTITVLLLLATSVVGSAQHTHGHGPDSSRMVGAADAAMSGPMSEAAKKHLELSPTRRATPEDTMRAKEVVSQLRSALAKYADTAAAVADGYKMFMPNVKEQRVYHFTNYKNAFLEGFRFDPEKPTSILYTRAPDGRLKLIGAMYTAPKRVRAARLDGRVPLSIARWHKHVNWCLPLRGEKDRWLERRNGLPLFGPESPIATRAACEDVGGTFYPAIFGWMIHANVFAGEDLATIFGHQH